MIVRVKYCGGCNASYDRPAFVRRLQEAFPSIRFVFSEAGLPVSSAGLPVSSVGLPNFVLAVCGCPVACAARESANGTRGRFAVTSQSDFTSVCNELRRAEAPL